MQNAIVAIIVAIISFLLGSIPWGVLISKFFYHKDVRDTGSGNIGFTNSMRSMGKVGGGAVFAGDFVKGLAAAAIGVYVAPMFCDATPVLWTSDIPVIMGAIATFSATMGHIFCPWLGWHGGKGISTAFGASFISFSVPAALIFFGSFLLAVIITKWVSLGSLVAAVEYPFGAFIVHGACPVAAVMLGVTGLVVIWAHRGNIKRLLNGTERKFGEKKEA